MSRQTSDAIVIGAGIIGAACTRALAQQGVKVRLIEPNGIGSGATATAMGHIVVMDDSEAQFALTRYSQQLWHEIVDRLPEDCEYEPCGTLWVAADEEEMTVVRSKEQFYTERGVDVEVLDPVGIAEAEPNLRPGLAGGLRVPGDCVVYPACVARWLIEQARQDGAEVHLGVSVTEPTDDGVRLDDGSSLSAGAIVLATGASAAKLIPGLPVEPRKGHLIITDRYPNYLQHQLIELGYLKSARSNLGDSVAFNVQPRRTGQLLVGSSRQYGDQTDEVDRSILARMIRRAVEYLPTLAQLSAVRCWTGFRASTPNKLPLIGPSPSHERFYLATGHEGLGIATSLGTAALLTAQILGHPPAITPEPYLPQANESSGS